MTQQNLAIPAVCMKCGELFDMTYDLKRHYFDYIEETLKRKNRKQQNLCWECRYS